MTGFWEYVAVAQQLRPDRFGDFVRLIGRRVLAHPKDVRSLADLRAVLAEARVTLPAETIRRIWAGYIQHQMKERP